MNSYKVTIFERNPDQVKMIGDITRRLSGKVYRYYADVYYADDQWYRKERVEEFKTKPLMSEKAAKEYVTSWIQNFKK